MFTMKGITRYITLTEGPLLRLWRDVSSTIKLELIIVSHLSVLVMLEVKQPDRFLSELLTFYQVIFTSQGEKSSKVLLKKNIRQYSVSCSAIHYFQNVVRKMSTRYKCHQTNLPFPLDVWPIDGSFVNFQITRVFRERKGLLVALNHFLRTNRGYLLSRK